MNTDLMFSSKSDDWETPQWLFDELNREFHFTLDPCADKHNHKCEKYYTKEQARTDTIWFHEYIYKKAEVRFLKGRLKFGSSKNSAPFLSMIVIFK